MPIGCGVYMKEAGLTDVPKGSVVCTKEAKLTDVPNGCGVRMKEAGLANVAHVWRVKGMGGLGIFSN